MTITTIDDSQRKAAKVAGLACLLTTAIIAAANFGINARLMVESNAVETAKNILAHESLFRFDIIAYLIYCAGILVLLTALYVILKPVNRAVALLATFLRFVYALVWIFIALNFFTALRLIGSTDYLRVFEADRLQALAKLYLSGYDAYYVGLLFWSLASTVCSWLWYKSNYIPGVLAAFGLISSAWCVACTIAFIIFPDFASTVNLWWFDSPMAIFEIVLSFWLLFKGLRPSGRILNNQTN
ncbi:MAG: DUF4386 domain-containing protein [Chitinophagaceae bacterium]|nr:DUF4386 domain-containing protein [Chitinophagaceae bacterium]